MPNRRDYAPERDGVYYRVELTASPTNSGLRQRIYRSPGSWHGHGRALLEGKVSSYSRCSSGPRIHVCRGTEIEVGTAQSFAFRCCAKASRSAFWSLTRHEVRPFTEKQIELVRRSPTRRRLRSRMCGCSKAWKPAPANWRSRWRSCAPRRTAWCRPRSSPRSAN